MVAAVAGAAVAVLPAIVGGEEGMQGCEQVVVAAGTGLDERDAGCRVRDEDVEEAVTACGDLPQEGLAVAGEVDDPLRRTGGDVQDSGGESVCHAPILTPERGFTRHSWTILRYSGSSPRDTIDRGHAEWLASATCCVQSCSPRAVTSTCCGWPPPRVAAAADALLPTFPAPSFRRQARTLIRAVPRRRRGVPLTGRSPPPWSIMSISHAPPDSPETDISESSRPNAAGPSALGPDPHPHLDLDLEPIVPT